MLLAIPRKLTNVLSALCVGTILALWQAHAYAQASVQKDIQPAALVAAWKLAAADLTPYFSTSDNLNFVGSGVPTRVRFA
jgi:hypothetical protein